MIASDFDIQKWTVIRGLFLSSADNTYISARLNAFADNPEEFYWCALHAAEKYMKAVLLLNGETSKNYSHNVSELFAEIKKLYPDLTPSQLLLPDGIQLPDWKSITPEQFLDRLERNGNADNRYNIYGYTYRTEDLIYLDAFVFAIRRLAVPLNYSANRVDAQPTYADCLKSNLKYYSRNYAMPLDQLIRDKKDSPKRHAALNLNMNFAPDYDHEDQGIIMRGSNSPLYVHILSPLESDNSASAKNAISIATWIVQQVQLPRHIVQQIQNAISAAKKKHKLP